jgi:hypothetical protein
MHWGEVRGDRYTFAPCAFRDMRIEQCLCGPECYGMRFTRAKHGSERYAAMEHLDRQASMRAAGAGSRVILLREHPTCTERTDRSQKNAVVPVNSGNVSADA